VTLLGDVLMGVGFFFILAGVVGILRLPDFYTRLHAMGKCDTLGVGLMVAGLALQEGIPHSSLKMGLIVVFVGLANPTATHALGRAATPSSWSSWSSPRWPPSPPATSWPR
jgi:multicomponent Na+:H+ antiporter subunit G